MRGKVGKTLCKEAAEQALQAPCRMREPHEPVLCFLWQERRQSTLEVRTKRVGNGHDGCCPAGRNRGFSTDVWIIFQLGIFEVGKIFKTRGKEMREHSL